MIPPIRPPPTPVATRLSVSGCVLALYAIPIPAPAPVAAPSAPPTTPHVLHCRGGGSWVEHPEIAAATPNAMQVARVRFRIDRGGRGFMELPFPPDLDGANFAQYSSQA
jgi:hypothetical protein